MSDVTAEEVNAEIVRASLVLGELGIGVIEPDRAIIARALATVRKEARRDALGEAVDVLSRRIEIMSENIIGAESAPGYNGLVYCRDVLKKQIAAIRALMGPT